jgi:hypothetical protein
MPNKHTDGDGAVVDRRAARRDEPTSRSIAEALAAQQRERLAFTSNTGILVDLDGQMLCPSDEWTPRSAER